MSRAFSYQRTGEVLFSKVEKVSGELFQLTYGALVTQLLRDYEDAEEVNKQLEKMGHAIGLRLVDDFLSKANIASCGNLVETAEIIAKVAFKMYLGTTSEVMDWNADKTSFSLVFRELPLTEYVELPEEFSELIYCNLLCGIVRGALEMVQLRVECAVISDQLKGDEITTIRVDLKEIMKEDFGGEED